ncbi:MAG: TlpA family protein disulfide reductase [Rhodospirillales bacterium]|nr:TlpA family protein disulfide reductase [Rhodospirillales bacterium]
MDGWEGFMLSRSFLLFRFPKSAFGLMAVMLLVVSTAQAADDAATVPHVSEKGQEGFREYMAEPLHKAFVVAPGGAWAWKSGLSSQDLALDKALASCREFTEQTCVPYAVDDDVVLDVDSWARLWGPYLNEEKASKAEVGVFKGDRLPDLRFTAPDGTEQSIGSLKGKVAIVHFWGSWCPPCRAEMPEIDHFHKALKGRDDVALILLQARESVEVSRSWAKRAGYTIPLYDSGVTGRSDSQFNLVGGAKIEDRNLAPTFPTTYVLDRRGIIVFSNVGQMSRLHEYMPFIDDVAARSGR